jgi:hypothetical protein
MRIAEPPLDRAISKMRSRILQASPGWRKDYMIEVIEELEKFTQYQCEYEQSLYVQGFADGYKVKNSDNHYGQISSIKSEPLVGQQGASIQGGEGYLSRFSAAHQ